MMEYTTLLKADLKRHKGSLAGVFILVLLVCAALGTVLTVWMNSERYVRAELGRAGFGILTAWVSDVPDMDILSNRIADLDEVSHVDIQAVIYSDYTVKVVGSAEKVSPPHAGSAEKVSPPHVGSAEKDDQNSDSEGQLIPYGSQETRYRFFEDDLSRYREETPEILPGQIYVSPSMISMFGVQMGDEISFPVARGGQEADFTVKGFYEDPFMGSSMIGMKGFLINEADYTHLIQMVQDSGIDALARNGAMLHVFPEEWKGESPPHTTQSKGDGALPQRSAERVTVSELNRIINENTGLPEYTEFLHSESAIGGFMMILQNAFGGLLAAFVLVLFFVILIVLGHSIGSAIEADYVNMGILKTVGFTGSKLRGLQLMQYLIAIVCGMLIGIVLAIPFSRFVSQATLTTTGIRIPTELPAAWCFLGCAVVFLVLIGFIILKTGKINRITPMKAIRGEAFSAGSGESSSHHSPERRRWGLTSLFGGKFSVKKGFPIQGSHLTMSMALRQLTAGSRRYAGACLVAILLVFFASMMGRMDSWLGADGKGMMDAFNPADHDIGVQMFGDHSSEDAENTVLSYTGITDRYLLAMPGVSVGGIDYTANVISDPERFHMIEGRTSMADNEIVVTEFVAADLGVSIGDTVTVQADLGSEEYVISGIYTCANDMGDNIGMSRDGYLKIAQDNPDIWCHHYFLENPSRKGAITEALEEIYGGDVHIHENTWPGLYGIISAMQALLMFLYVMVAAFILIVTIMTGSKILSAEQRDIGIYKAVGFTSGQLRGAFALRFLMVAVLSSVIGNLLAVFLTDPLVSMVMKMAGISNFSSSMTAVSVLVPSAVVIVLFTGFAYAASWKVKKVDLTVLITE